MNYYDDTIKKNRKLQLLNLHYLSIKNNLSLIYTEKFKNILNFSPKRADPGNEIIHIIH
jgi:hypothetical protein